MRLGVVGVDRDRLRQQIARRRWIPGLCRSSDELVRAGRGALPRRGACGRNRHRRRSRTGPRAQDCRGRRQGDDGAAGRELPGPARGRPRHRTGGSRAEETCRGAPQRFSRRSRALLLAAARGIAARDREQELAELLRRLRPQRRVLGEHAQDQRFHDRRDRRVRLLAAGRNRRLVDLTGEHVHRVRSVEGQLTRDHLVEDDPDGVQVAAAVELPSGGLLRRHVLRGPADQVAAREHGQIAIEDLRDPEVEDLDVVRVIAPLLHHHVLGLEVAVDDVVRVGLAEGRQHLRHDVAEALFRDRPLVAEHQAQVFPVHVLHHDVERAVGIVATEVEHLDAVRMVEAARRQRLALEPPHDRRILEQRRLEHLQANEAVQGQVPGAVDLAHSALSDQLLELETPSDRLADPGVARRTAPESRTGCWRRWQRESRSAVHAHFRGTRRKCPGASRARCAAPVLRRQGALPGRRRSHRWRFLTK